MKLLGFFVGIGLFLGFLGYLLSYPGKIFIFVLFAGLMYLLSLFLLFKKENKRISFLTDVFSSIGLGIIIGFLFSGVKNGTLVLAILLLAFLLFDIIPIIRKMKVKSHERG